MRRMLLLALLALVFGVFAALGLRADSGYVLLSWRGWVLETSLPAFVGAALAGVGALYAAINEGEHARTHLEDVIARSSSPPQKQQYMGFRPNRYIFMKWVPPMRLSTLLAPVLAWITSALNDSTVQPCQLEEAQFGLRMVVCLFRLQLSSSSGKCGRSPFTATASTENW